VASTRHALNPPPLSLRHEVVRKALHLATGSLPVAYTLGVRRELLLATLAGTTIAALLIEGARRTSNRIGARFNQAFGSIMRERERSSLTGATWLSLSCLVAVAVLSRNAAIAALWCAAVGDPVATIAGRTWALTVPEPTAGRAGKSIAGSLACALVSFAGVSTLAGYPPLTSAAVAVAAAFAESLPVGLDDNVRVAAAAGAVAQFLA
jgi:dolichol kinase